MRTRLAGHESRFAYSIYLTAGFIAWNLFGELLQRSVGIFVHNSALLKKVSVHKLAFPAIASLSALIQVGILLVCFLVFLMVSGNFPGISLIAVVPVIAITGFLAMGLGLFLATINVFYRDVEHTTNVALQFWFWITPIAYPIAALPPVAQRIIAWNPMSPVVGAMQDIFVAQRFPDWSSLAYPVVLAMALAILARLSFGRLADELVDEL
jgi:lipopolysaccharide transport system permease protein